MNYKRLTDKKLRDTDIYPVLDEHGNVIVDRRLFNMFIEKHNRLAEIEDKIEQGTLIELPCKVGTVLYEVIPKCTNGGLSCPYNGGYGTSRCKNGCGAYIAEEKFTFLSMREHFGKTLFLTREEAEKRLKELQNERD